MSKRNQQDHKPLALDSQLYYGARLLEYHDGIHPPTRLKMRICQKIAFREIKKEKKTKKERL